MPISIINGRVMIGNDDADALLLLDVDAMLIVMLPPPHVELELEP